MWCLSGVDHRSLHHSHRHAAWKLILNQSCLERCSASTLCDVKALIQEQFRLQFTVQAGFPVLPMRVFLLLYQSSVEYCSYCFPSDIPALIWIWGPTSLSVVAPLYHARLDWTRYIHMGALRRWLEPPVDFTLDTVVLFTGILHSKIWIFPPSCHPRSMWLSSVDHE